MMLEHYRGHETFVRRILDYMKQSERQRRCIITPFLTPYEQEIAKSVVGKQMFYRLDGGYEQAERKRFAIAPFMIEETLSIVCLKAKIKNEVISHRDVLGALMRLQLEREVFGDIVIQNQCIYLFVVETMSDFIVRECKRIKHIPIEFQICSEMIENKQTLQYRIKTISSMRLDCVVSACANVSRTKAEQFIKGKLVKLNHIPLEDCKTLCHNNSTISIRGFGRFHIRYENKKSRKGRCIIEIGTYD